VRPLALVLLGVLAACSEQGGSRPPVTRDAADSTSSGVAARIEQVVWNQTPPAYTSDTHWALIRRAYDARRYAPLWLSAAGPTDAGAALISALCDALDEGIHPAAFTADSSAGLLSVEPDGWDSASAGALARTDLRLTAAFLDYLGTLAAGQVDPGSVTPTWHTAAPPAPPDSALTGALRLPPGEAADLFRPASPAYDGLRAAFARYRLTAMSGDWMLPDTVRPLREGLRDSAVLLLRRRLIRTADLAAPESASTLFDDTVLAAVRHAQRRLGLRPDGVVGPGTWHALTVPAAARARSLAANLERYRWLPRGGKGIALVLDAGAGTAELWIGPERRFAGKLRLGAPCRVGPPVLADTLRELRPEGSGMKATMAGGVTLRLAPAASGMTACAQIEGYDSLTPLLAPAATAPTVLYLLAPTASTSPAGGTTFRADSSGSDDRLEASLGPALSRGVPPACRARYVGSAAAAGRRSAPRTAGTSPD
jgi:hypothetical protein